MSKFFLIRLELSPGQYVTYSSYMMDFQLSIRILKAWMNLARISSPLSTNVINVQRGRGTR